MVKAILWNMPDSELHCEKAHAGQVVVETSILLKGKLQGKIIEYKPR